MQGRRPDSSKGHQPRLEPGPSLTIPSSIHPLLASQAPEPRRGRLPPRSRSGCWTCRSRKVKCDERKPECGECLRLGHVCDYNPRLSFRDDTPRTVERMRETFVVGVSVFDEGFSPPADHSLEGTTEDLLPPFSTLMTDEERERKAELQPPGTYHVITNPETFANDEEQRSEGNSSLTSNLVQRSNSDHDSDSVAGGPWDSAGNEDLYDPNTIILKNFDDVLRVSSQAQHRADHIQMSPTNFRHRDSLREARNSFSQSSRADGSQISWDNIELQGRRDADLIRHYRATISPQIFKNVREQDLLKCQAEQYPPLYHAIMALAALSMARRNGVQYAAALEHYQQVIPALKNAVQSQHDSFSDGAFLTHFILLLYEIAAVSNLDSNMWQHHSNQLLRITSLRRQVHSTDSHEFLVWNLLSIDIFALLSMSGTGSFAEALQGHMLPPSEYLLSCTLSKHSQASQGSEGAYIPDITKLFHDVHLVALQTGQLAKKLREGPRQRGEEVPPQNLLSQTSTSDRRARVQNLHSQIEQCGDKWGRRLAEYLALVSWPNTTSTAMFDLTMHSHVLFCSCVIYAHTSMFPLQPREPWPQHEQEIETNAKAIIEAAQKILSRERVDVRYIIFPLFMAGFASRDQITKNMALNLMHRMERHSFGGSTKRSRQLLERVCEKQRQAVIRSEDPGDVDWVEEMEVMGQQLIMYGL